MKNLESELEREIEEKVTKSLRVANLLERRNSISRGTENLWRFEEITDPNEINLIRKEQEEIYNLREIGDSKEARKIHDYGNEKIIALMYNKGSERNPFWIPKIASHITRRSDAGNIPSELNLNYMPKEDKIRFENLLDLYDDGRIKEIGGFVNIDKSRKEKRGEYSCENPFESLYRFVLNIGLYVLNTTDLWVQTHSKAHTKWYSNLSTLPYQVIAGDIKKPYTDQSGREAITLGLTNPVHEIAYREIIEKSPLHREILRSYNIKEDEEILVGRDRNQTAEKYELRVA